MYSASEMAAGGFDLLVTVGGVAAFGVAELFKTGKYSASQLAKSGLFDVS